MSLITKCPACTTMFKIVADQLRVSDGWVRCGQCDEVFDANLSLQDENGLVSNTFAAEAEQGLEGFASESAQAANNLGEPLPEPASSPAAVESDPFLVINPHALHLEPDAHLGTLDAQGPKPTILENPGVLPPASADNVLQDHADVNKPSFLRKQGKPSIWIRRSVRIFLALVCLLLCLLLVLRVAQQERDWIAANVPATIPALEAMCGVMGCTVGPYRHIEAVVIDSSSFTIVRSDVYRLNLALKNTAQISVATPALELTLTDMQDQPVIRRIFLANEFAGDQDVMGAGTELSVSLPIAVKMANSSEKISGYRLLSFYP